MMLLGLTNNQNLSGVHVDLSSNELRNPGAMVLEAVIGYLHNISSLDISNNGTCMAPVKLAENLTRNLILLTHVNVAETYDYEIPITVCSFLMHCFDNINFILSIYFVGLNNDLASICAYVHQSKSLRKLNIGRNFDGIKPK